jgi:hypothetical protein
MVQEVERNTATLSMIDESNSTLRMTDKEYKGQRSILNTTRYMLTSLQRQDVIDRCFPFICMHFFPGLATMLQFSVWFTILWNCLDMNFDLILEQNKSGDCCHRWDFAGPL